MLVWTIEICGGGSIDVKDYYLLFLVVVSRFSRVLPGFHDGRNGCLDRHGWSVATGIYRRWC